MNNALIKILDGVNQLLAFVLIAIGAFVGAAVLPSSFSLIVGIFIGILGGSLVAGIVCGMIALLVNIEQHLRKMASDAVSKTQN